METAQKWPIMGEVRTWRQSYQREGPPLNIAKLSTSLVPDSKQHFILANGLVYVYNDGDTSWAGFVPFRYFVPIL